MFSRRMDTVLLLFIVVLINLTQAFNSLKLTSEYCHSYKNGTVWNCNYIPQEVPQGFSQVYINASDNNINCYNTSFESKTWLQVEWLTIENTNYDSFDDFHLQSNCFHNLKKLKSLSINIDGVFTLPSPIFKGLDSIKTLSLRNCIRLDWISVLAALDSKDKVPNVTDLDLTKVSNVNGAVNFDKTAISIINNRKITRITLNEMQVSFLDGTTFLKSLNHLKYVNLTRMNVNAYVFKNKPEDVKHITTLDITDIILPKSSISTGPVKLYNIKLWLNQFHKSVNLIFFIKTVIASGLTQRSSFFLYNCEVILNTYITMETESLNLSDNNFIHIDLKISGDVKYKNLSIKYIDLSSNKMNFLHPTFFSLCPKLLSINLSQNDFNTMLQDMSELFEDLLNSTTLLQTIDMSTNNLEWLPTNMFIHNHDLEEILLSNNLLQQISWKMDHLKKLRYLDLTNNKISNLDLTSLNSLIRFVAILPKNNTFKLNFRNNPILCWSCKCKPFIEWLTQTKTVDLSKLFCQQENGVKTRISTTVVKQIESYCFTKTIILLCTIVPGSIFICLVLLIVVYVRQKKIRRKHEKMFDLLTNLQEGEGQYEFVLMLAYNNLEEDFIRQYVRQPLNNILKTAIGVDRDLVLTGDRHFRPGFMIHNEIASCLERVAMVMLLITNDFCTSGFCLSELDQAWIQRKPMIFMFKENVDENLMTPLIKTMYKKNVRILWDMVDGEYILKTTWENVCDAILELLIK